MQGKETRRRRPKTNRKTLERLATMRNLLAVGTPDYEIRDRLQLSKGQYRRLKAHHLSEHGAKGALEYFTSHEASKQLAQREAWEVFQTAKEGIPHPMRGTIQDDGKMAPDWLVKPSPAMALQALRLIQDIDKGVIDVGFRLGVLQEAPKRINVQREDNHTLTVTMDTTERQALIDRLSKVLEQSSPIIDVEASETLSLPPASCTETLDLETDEVETSTCLDNVILFDRR